jgi:hypothetical protein
VDNTHGNYRWEAWEPAEITVRLSGVDAPWCVAAGWAIDLFLGAPTRTHADLEIAVPADRYHEIRDRLPELEFFAVDDGTLVPLAAGEAPAPHTHQTWVLDRPAGRWRFDVFREPADGDTWICRRDPAIRRPYREVIERTGEGIPYLAPEIALLFKAKAPRPKDEADLAAALPRLTGDRRAWLASALARVHPGHSWLDLLGSPYRVD